VEQRIADQLSVSRTPVHEAIIRLQHERLVRVLPRRGVQVLPMSASDMIGVCWRRDPEKSGAAVRRVRSLTLTVRPEPRESMNEHRLPPASTNSSLIYFMVAPHGRISAHRRRSIRHRGDPFQITKCQLRAQSG
jgi:DNA-binding GntR family transcriptional regulator